MEEKKQDIQENAIEEMLRTKLLPKLEEKKAQLVEFVREKIGNDTLTGISDPAKLQDIFAKLHGLLPLPVRLLLKKEKFIDYCLKNKEKISLYIDQNLKK